MSQWLAEALRMPVQAWLSGEPHMVPQKKLPRSGPIPQVWIRRPEGKRGQHDTISRCEGFPELQQATAQSKPAGGGEAKKEEKKAKRNPARFQLRGVQDSGSLLSPGALHLVLVTVTTGICLMVCFCVRGQVEEEEEEEEMDFDLFG